MVYGKLTVVSTHMKLRKDGRQRSEVSVCRCECGNTIERFTYQLKKGKVKSCGCLQRGAIKCEDPKVLKRRSLFHGTRARARKNNIIFTITQEDIVIPDFCPLLDIPLSLTNSKLEDDSPSIDRLIPKLGYVAGNIQVISMRANMIKSNASIDELMLLTERLHAIFIERAGAD